MGDYRVQHLNLVFQGDDNNSDSDEEPSPEALARYLAMRRHTVGVGDTKHEVRMSSCILMKGSASSKNQIGCACCCFLSHSRDAFLHVCHAPCLRYRTTFG